MLLIVTQEVKIQRDPLPAYGLRCLPRFQESLGLPYPRDAFFGCPTLRVVERPRREQRSRLKTKSRGPEKSGGSFLPTFPSTPDLEPAGAPPFVSSSFLPTFPSTPGVEPALAAGAKPEVCCAGLRGSQCQNS